MKPLLIILLFFSLSACTNFLFVPVKPHPITPNEINITHQDIFIESSDGHLLHGWKLLAKTKKEGTILFFHGNGDNVSTQLPNTFWLTKVGYDVYVFDYSGYGKSEGSATLNNTINDLELMIKHVVTELPKKEKLILMGHSLGASMAIHSVAHSKYKNKIRALLSVAAFSDYHDITQEVLSRNWLFWLFQWPLSFTVDNTYRPLNAISMISPVPVLIMHGNSDKLIDDYHAYRLFEAAGQPKDIIIIDSGHNDTFNNIENRKLLIKYLSGLP